MRTFLPLGTVPHCERAPSPEDANYATKAVQLCQRYRDIIRRQLGNERHATELKIELVPDDHGGRYEVVVCYDPTNPLSVAAAHRIERLTPQKWADVDSPRGVHGVFSTRH